MSKEYELLFPNDGTDWIHDVEGVAISKNDRDRWIREAAKELPTSTIDNDFYYTASGDSLVIGLKHEEDGVIEIYDCVVRRRAILVHKKDGDKNE